MLYGRVSHVAECPDIGPQCASKIPPSPYNHHINLLLTNIDVALSYGITDWLAVETQLRLGIVDVKASFTELDGSPRSENKADDTHHRTEVLAGPRDPWVTMRAGGRLDRFTSYARLGVSVPAGRTEPNPYVLGREGKTHQHIQFGSGTFRPIVGANVKYSWAPMDLSLGGIAVFNLYDNRHGFRAPSRFGANLTTELKLLDGKLRPSAKVVFAHQEAELWNGTLGDEPNYARSVVLAGLGVAYQFSEVWRANAEVLVRLADVSKSPSFDTPGQISVGLNRSFDLSQRDDD